MHACVRARSGGAACARVRGAGERPHARTHTRTQRDAPQYWREFSEKRSAQAKPQLSPHRVQLELQAARARFDLCARRHGSGLCGRCGAVATSLFVRCGRDLCCVAAPREVRARERRSRRHKHTQALPSLQLQPIESKRDATSHWYYFCERV